MERMPFKAPVTVFVDKARKFRVVAGVAEASDFLFDYWSDNDTNHWMSAMNQCSAALEGSVQAEDARSAFIVAVSGAGMRTNAEISLP
jgi:hypothetical protein